MPAMHGRTSTVALKCGLSKRGAVPTWNSKSYVAVVRLIISAHKAEEGKYSACCVQLPSCHFLQLCMVEVTINGGS